MSHFLNRVLLALFLIPIVSASGTPPLQNRSGLPGLPGGLPGLIVEVVTPDAPAAKAGLKVGDRILTYDERELGSPAALEAAEGNTFGKQEIALQVRRGEERLTLKAPLGSLGIKVRPELPPGMLQLYEEGRESLQAQKLKEAIGRWEEAAKAAPAIEAQAAAWIYGRIGETYERQRQWRQVIEAYTAAWNILRESGDAAAQSRTLSALGRASQNLNDLAAAERWFEQARKIDATAGHEVWVVDDLNRLGAIAFYRGDLQRAQDHHRQALMISERLAPDSLSVATSLHLLGNVASLRGDLQKAQDYYGRALAIRERLAPDSLDVAVSLNGLGIVASQRHDLPAAHDYHHRALAIRERLAPDSLDVASSLNNLGNIARARSDLPAAQDYYRRALAIRERLAPDSLAIALSLTTLGSIAQARGDLQTAQDYYRQALAIRERLAPNSLDAAVNLNSLGDIANIRGDLQAAQDYYRRSLAIRERLVPDSLDVAENLNGLGVIAQTRGDLQAAQDYYRRALVIWERLAPDSLDVTVGLNNLGGIAHMRGDLQAAEDYYRRALAIRERLAPDSLNVAISLTNLGMIAKDRGDLQTAQGYYRRALAIRERLAPDSLDVAVSLNNLGAIAYHRDDLQAAQDYHRRALAIRERLAPRSLVITNSLDNLGAIARMRGDLQTAQDYYRRSLAILEQLAPQSLDLALNLTDMGELAFSARRFSDARPLFDRAVSIIEAQRRGIFSSEARSLLLARYHRPYTGLLQTHLALEDLPAAFATFERARARSLVELLAERKLDHRADVPADLLNQQEQLDQNRSTAYAALAKLNSQKDSMRIEELQSALTRCDIQQRELEAQFRRASPRFANLQYPEPLDLNAARAALDEGTLLLAYYVVEKQTYMFAVTRTGLKVFTLAFGEAALTSQVNAFRDAVSLKRLGNSLREGRQQGQKLYDDLIRPAQDWVSEATRILICPDGALHALPFAALISQTDPTPHYFIERKPLHTIVSMTVYAETRKSAAARDNNPEQTVLAFGDAIYTREQTAAAPKQKSAAQPRERVADGWGEVNNHDPLVADLRQRGLSWGPLPGTRKEVVEIARLYGSAATVKLGQDATKLAAKQESPNYTILHFAVHGWLDDQIGLNSGLALSQPEVSGRKAEKGNNGLWQAWEIIGQTRVKADLVVLSACLTGLGQTVRGEGIVGLTRAFQYAGAKSVVVSMWSVSDASTAALMSAFYQELRRGVVKDVALQKAMLVVRSNPKWAHPYYWSAFILTGDWK
jgi:CHAT domain-containing protein/Tfp pilus assembly protein PilF